MFALLGHKHVIIYCSLVLPVEVGVNGVITMALSCIKALVFTRLQNHLLTSYQLTLNLSTQAETTACYKTVNLGV